MAKPNLSFIHTLVLNLTPNPKTELLLLALRAPDEAVGPHKMVFVGRIGLMMYQMQDHMHTHPHTHTSRMYVFWMLNLKEVAGRLYRRNAFPLLITEASVFPHFFHSFFLLNHFSFRYRCCSSTLGLCVGVCMCGKQAALLCGRRNFPQQSPSVIVPVMSCSCQRGFLTHTFT